MKGNHARLCGLLVVLGSPTFLVLAMSLARVLCHGVARGNHPTFATVRQEEQVQRLELHLQGLMLEGEA